MTTPTKFTTRTCAKCQHVNNQSTMGEHEACPKCGGIYSRVEAYLRAERAGPPSRAAIPQLPIKTRATSRPTGLTGPLVDPDFIDAMRAESLYPTFRGLVKLGTWFFYLVAVIAVVGAFVNDNSGSLKVGVLLGALVLVIFVTAAKEASLMLADMSDAAVIRAAQANNTGDSL